MGMKQTFDFEPTRAGRGSAVGMLARLLRRYAHRASDRRLARWRLALERHPLKAPCQATPPAVNAGLSAADCARQARRAEAAGQFAAAAAWWAAAAAAETASLAKAVEAGQWPSQAAYARYARRGNRRVGAYASRRRAAENAADTITRKQRAHGLCAT